MQLRARILGIGILLLTPCFWQPKIIAGDLSSHVYNAWLAGEIREGRAPGLAITSVWTNVMTDWALESLGASDFAAKVVAGSAVVVFFWGAFFLLNSTSGALPWALTPLLGILSYGVIFHLGFLNFYLSVGLCLWILGLLWHPTPRKALYALPVAGVAILAHVLPLAWAVAVLGYLYLFRRIPAAYRWMLPILSLVCLVAARQLLIAQFASRWSWNQVALAGFFGADQAWIYDDKYLLIATCLLLCMIAMFLQRNRQLSLRGDPVAQIWILHLVACALLPGAIQVPPFQSTLAYIPLRISLFGAICFCILASQVRQGRGVTRLLGAVTAVFFACLFWDSAALNRVENEVAKIVREAPAGSRVIASIVDQGARVNGLAHVAERACIGHCFSYANYEPATAQFRVRVEGEGAAATATGEVVQEIERGEHVVTPFEAPLQAVCSCEADSESLCLRRLDAGERTCLSRRKITLRLLP